LPLLPPLQTVAQAGDNVRGGFIAQIIASLIDAGQAVTKVVSALRTDTTA
jgi:hypothetical protein